ncbi:MAG: sohB [Moraxellaceae bacterium]|nr:sohB [Moraxellaceae bacterium]
MLDLLLQYGLFLAKTVTVVIALLIIIVAIGNMGGRRRSQDEGDIEVTHVNERLRDYADALRGAVLDKQALKAWLKSEKQTSKKEQKEKKARAESEESRVYVLTFHGDIRASAVEMLRREITAVLTLADPAHDEVVLCLESPGGLVHGYGLAASQLARIRQKNLPLTICVDKVAASGGYMMACLGSKVLAAPFAVVGSIGVVAQIPNFNKLLRKHDIDFEVLTAGEYKRTLTVFGENTEAGRQKFQEELEDTHELFKEFVQQNRPQLDIARVATGEHWYGQRALEHKLVDELKTSDEYLAERAAKAEVFTVRYVPRHRLLTRLGLSAETALDRILLRWWDRLQQRPWW